MLHVRLFGSVELHSEKARLRDFPTRKSKAIFAMLVLQPDRVIPRERLTDWFWRDLPESQARKCLSSDLWRIREVIRSGGLDPAAYLFIHDHGIGFAARTMRWLDVEAFEDKLGAVLDESPERLTDADLQRLEQAVEIYRGDLLDNVYDDWVLVHREALRAEYQAALETLMYGHRIRRHYARAVIYGQKLLDLDPLLEHVHRELMLCYRDMGNRAAALKQYALCVDHLRQELGIEPMPETEDLRRRLCSVRSRKDLANVSDRTGPRRSGLRRGADHSAFDGLRRAMQNLESAYSLIQDVSTRLDANGSDGDAC